MQENQPLIDVPFSHISGALGSCAVCFLTLLHSWDIVKADLTPGLKVVRAPSYKVTPYKKRQIQKDSCKILSDNQQQTGRQTDREGENIVMCFAMNELSSLLMDHSQSVLINGSSWKDVPRDSLLGLVFNIFINDLDLT